MVRETREKHKKGLLGEKKEEREGTDGAIESGGGVAKAGERAKVHTHQKKRGGGGEAPKVHRSYKQSQ